MINRLSPPTAFAKSIAFSKKHLWVRSFNAVHGLSSIEKKNLGRKYLGPGLLGEKRKRYLYAICYAPPLPFSRN